MQREAASLQSVPCPSVGLCLGIISYGVKWKYTGDILELLLAQTRTYIHVSIRVGIRTQLRLLFCAIEHNVLEFNLTADRTTNAGQQIKGSGGGGCD